MNSKVHRYIFEIIAPVYNWFFKSQNNRYREILLHNEALLDVPQGSRVLDIGCGTGALTQAFASVGYSVTGVDIAWNMVAFGRKRGLDCRYGNVLEGLDFPDGTFDLVVCAYVVHGLDRSMRAEFFKEAARISKGPVLIHDYARERPFGTTLIEFLEGGGYFSFIKTGEAEMRNFFPDVSVVSVGKNACWYICRGRVLR